MRADSASLIAYLSNCLPTYMRPDAIGVLDELPLSVNGKVNISLLPDPSSYAHNGDKHISTCQVK